MSRTERYRRTLGSTLVVLTCLVSAACSSGGSSVFQPGASGSAATSPVATTQAPPTLTLSAGATSAVGGDPAKVLLALRDRLSSADATYRIHVSSRISVGVVYNYEIDMAVAGEDISGTVVASSGSQETTISVVAVDDRGYVRVGAGEWTEIDMSSVESMASEWLDLTDPDYFTFDRIEGTGDSALYLFRNSKPIPQTPESNSVITWGTVTITDCVLKVRPDGTPVSMEATEVGTATMSGSKVTVNGTMAYTFTDVGKPIKIEAPV